ncbi:MAG: Ger(x)C family spore germination protein [Turicibacter sp.]
MLKKFLFVFSMIGLLSGCLNSPYLKSRTIIQMMAIDYDAIADEFILTIQVFSPEGGGSQSGFDSSKQNVRYIENRGKNISSTIINATLKQGKIPFYGDNRVIIIGADASKESLPEILSYLNNDHEARSNIKFLVTKGKAADIIKTPLGQGIMPAEGISGMIENSKINGKILSVSLLDLAQAYLSTSISPVIPVISLKEQSKQNKESNNESSQTSDSEIKAVSPFEIDGTAVFKSRKLVGYLDEAQTRGLVFMRNKLKESVFDVETSTVETATIGVIQSKTKIKFSPNDQDLVMRVSINSKSNLKDILLNEKYDKLKDEDISQLEHEVEKIIEAECKSVVEKALYDLNVDLFYFGDIIWKKDPKLWKQIEKNYSEYIGKIKVEYDINVTINRIGLEQFM